MIGGPLGLQGTGSSGRPDEVVEGKKATQGRNGEPPNAVLLRHNVST